MKQIPVVRVLFSIMLLCVGATARADHAAGSGFDAHQGEGFSAIGPLLPALDPLACFEARLQTAGIIPRRSTSLSHPSPRETGLDFTVDGLRIERHEVPLRRGHIEAALRRVFRPLSITPDQGLVYALRSDFIPSGVRQGDWAEIRAAVDESGGVELASLTLHLAAAPTPIRVYRVRSRNGLPHYYDAQGFRYQPRLFNSPIDYMTITSYLGDGRNHKGLDLQAPTGTPIRTPYKAVVEGRSWSRSKQGLALQLLYVDLGIRARFFHLSRIAPGIKKGRALDPGAIIALSGNTGHSTGPHLHYQLEDARTGAILDPLRVHGFGSERLQPDEQRAFEAWMAFVDAPSPPSEPHPTSTKISSRTP